MCMYLKKSINIFTLIHIDTYGSVNGNIWDIGEGSF